MASEKKIIINDVIEEISSLWGCLEDKQKDILRDNLQIRKYHKNEIIYKELEMPDELMYLVSGKVKIYKDGPCGKFQIMRVFKPKEFFGYRAYLARQEYHTSAIALEECMIAFLPINILLDFLQNDTSICLFFIEQFAVELGRADIRTINLTLKHVRGRLAETLLFLIDSYGIDKNGWIGVSMSRADIANLSNMTTSNAIRTLSAFVNEKVIVTKARRIQIINYGELQKIAELG